MNYEAIVEEILVKVKVNAEKTISEVLSEFTKGEVGVLAYLVFEKNNVTPGELSERINVTSARIASILNSLENKKYIQRNVNDTDKRKILVTVTEEGKANVEEAKNKLINKISSVFEQLGEEDTKEYIRLVSKINDILSKER